VKTVADGVVELHETIIPRIAGQCQTTTDVFESFD
jgi:hypothetical protein